MKKIKDVTGVILAGGKSLRYGRNKALVKIDGIPLIERAITVMNSLFRHLILITNTPDEYSYLKLPMHEDLIKGLGPLGGIFTALMTIRNEAGFFVACDMPYLNRELIHHMVEVRDDFDAVVPRTHGGTEALHALYGKRCLPPIKRLIDSSQYQILRFFPKVSVRYIDENEIRRFDPPLASFFNINKPDAMKNVGKIKAGLRSLKKRPAWPPKT
jgi:molybdopterin-guanine dinucleotide biosynthesis protein A